MLNKLVVYDRYIYNENFFCHLVNATTNFNVTLKQL